MSRPTKRTKGPWSRGSIPIYGTLLGVTYNRRRKNYVVSLKTEGRTEVYSSDAKTIEPHQLMDLNDTSGLLVRLWLSVDNRIDMIERMI